MYGWAHMHERSPYQFPWVQFVRDFPLLKGIVAQFFDREGVSDEDVSVFLHTLSNDLTDLYRSLSQQASKFKATIDDFGF